MRERNVLVALDAEGDRREFTFPTLEEAQHMAEECSRQNNTDPWRDWEIWGNDPITGEWIPIAQKQEKNT